MKKVFKNPETGNIKYINYESYIEMKKDLTQKNKLLKIENEELKDILQNLHNSCASILEKIKEIKSIMEE